MFVAHDLISRCPIVWDSSLLPFSKQCDVMLPTLICLRKQILDHAVFLQLGIKYVWPEKTHSCHDGRVKMPYTSPQAI